MSNATIAPDEQSRSGHNARQPTQIPSQGWSDILRRVWCALGRDHIWVAAAGLAFCSMFAAIPGVAVAVAVLSQAADTTLISEQVPATAAIFPKEASRFLAEQAQAFAAASRLHLTTGLVAAIWAARAAASILVSVLNIAYRERERRGLLRYHATVLVLTVGICGVGLMALGLIAVVPLMERLAASAAAVADIISFGRWPALAVLMTLALAVIYRLAPCRSRAKWRWVTVGAVAATALWLAGSAAFSAYIGRFASYDETFGVLGTVMVLMTWFYLTAFAVLLGAELNAEVERQTAQDTTEGPDLPLGRRGARMADIVDEH